MEASQKKTLIFRYLIFLLSFSGSSCSGDLFVGFLAYTGHFNMDATGHCCQGLASDQVCRTPCNLLFDISVFDSNGTQLIGQQRPSGIPLLSDHYEVIFPLPFLSDHFTNPVTFGLPKLTPDITLSVQVYDIGSERLSPLATRAPSRHLVDNITFSLEVDKPSDFFHCRDVQGTVRSNTRLKLALRYSCHQMYAGKDCTTDCFLSRRLLMCLNQDTKYTDGQGQTNWPFGSPLARCPAPSGNTSMDNVTSSVPVTTTTMTSLGVGPTSTQAMTGHYTFATSSDMSSTATTPDVIDSNMTTEMSRTKSTITNNMKTHFTTTLLGTQTTDVNFINSYTTSSISSSQSSDSDFTKYFTSSVKETKSTESGFINSIMATSTFATQGANSNSDVINSEETSSSVYATSRGTQTLQTLSPSVSQGTETWHTSHTPLPSSELTSSKATAMTEPWESKTSMLSSSSVIVAPTKSESKSITTSDTVRDSESINSSFQTTALQTSMLQSTGTVESSTHLGTKTLATHAPTFSTKVDTTPSTESTNAITSVSTETRPTDNTITPTKASQTTSVSHQTSSSLPGHVTSPTVSPSSRPGTTNKIVQPTFLDDPSSSSSDPMQFWGIIVGSVLGGLAIIGVLGYAIYRSRQRGLQKRQEIYTVTPQMTSMIGENGTSGRSDVPMTTALL